MRRMADILGGTLAGFRAGAVVGPIATATNRAGEFAQEWKLASFVPPVPCSTMITGVPAGTGRRFDEQTGHALTCLDGEAEGGVVQAVSPRRLLFRRERHPGAVDGLRKAVRERGMGRQGEGEHGDRREEKGGGRGDASRV